MNKLYLLLSAALISTASLGQTNLNILPVKVKQVNTVSNPQLAKSGQNPPKLLAVIWQDDFSTPANWTMANTGTPSANWAIGTAAPTGAFSGPMGAIASSTAFNNFALFDSDALGSGTSTQDATITTVSSINCSSNSSVNIVFESYYRNYQGATYVEVSNNGSTWIQYQVHTALAQFASSANPEVVTVNISATAANQATVYIRFRYIGGWDYAWMVDDVKLEDAAVNELQLLEANHDSVLTGFSMEYTMSPVQQSQANPLAFEGVISNVGSADQTNTRLSASLSFNASPVFGSFSASGFTLNSTAQDTFITTTQYTASSIGNYDVNFSGFSDSISNTNIISKSFQVTDSVYARDAGTIAYFYTVSNACGGRELGHAFDIYANDTATSISAYIYGAYSVPGAAIQATLYAADFATIVAQSSVYTLQAGDMDNFVTLSFSTSPVLSANTTYVAVIGAFQSTTDSVAIGAVGTVPIQTSFLKDVDGCYGTAGTWYYVANAPMVRLNFGSTPVCALPLVMTGTDETFAGANDGTATATATGGTSPYTYSWSNGGTTSSISGLAPGTYTVTVTDAGICVATSSIVVNTGPCVLTLTMASTMETSAGANNGTATATVSGGIIPYTYNWSNGGTTSSISGLAGGTYSVTVTDAVGCFTTNSVVVSTSSCTFTVTMSSTAETVAGANDGTATATATGGTSPYTYNWSNGGTTSSISGLAPGTYGVTVTDANVCASTGSSVINPGSGCTFTLTVSSTDETAAGANDGTATAAATGGSIPYTYSWSNGGTTSSISGLAPGTYAVTVTDAASCMATGSTVVNAGGCTFTLTVSSTDETFAGANDGTATATATGGTSPYTYNWSNAGTTSSISGLAPGTYAVTVTDAAGCIATGSTAVNTGGCALTLAMTGTDETSAGANDGTATVTPSAGTIPYTYNWSNGGTTSSISGLAPGTYGVTVTDAAACVANGSMVINAGSTSAICNDASCSATTLTVGSSCNTVSSTTVGATSSCGEDAPASSYYQGGDVWFKFTVPNSEHFKIEVSFTDANADASMTMYSGTACGSLTEFGSYYTTISSFASYSYSYACQPQGSVIWLRIFERYNSVASAFTICVFDDTPPSGSPNVTFAGLATSYCITDPSVTLTGSPTGGTFTGPGVSSNQFNPSVAGSGSHNITYSYTDGNGCTGNSTQNVTVNLSPTVNVTTVDATCGNADGSATATASGGNSPYTYLWSSGGTGSTESNLAGGSYAITLTDANGCSVTDNTTINEVGGPTVTITGLGAEYCVDDPGVTLTGSPSGGAFSGTGVISNQFDPSIASAGIHAITYTYTDGNGCTGSSTQNVTVNSLPTASITTTDATCGNADGAATVSASGGSSPYTYSWSTGSTTSIVANLAVGSYTVTVTDAKGCSVIESTSINEIGAPAVNISASVGASCTGCCDGSAIASATGGTLPYTYLWSDPSNQTTSIATGLCAGTYNVTVTGADNCSATALVIIGEPVGIANHSPEINLKIYPNPNRGLFTLEIQIEGIQDMEVTITNMVGQQVLFEKLTQVKGTYQKEINLKRYSPGIYQLQLRTANGDINRRIVIE